MVRTLFVCLLVAGFGLSGGAQSPPTVTLGSGPNPAWVNEPVTLTALVSGDDGGAVVFADSGVPLGTVPLVTSAFLGADGPAVTTAGTSDSVATGDFNGDGIGDVAVAVRNVTFSENNNWLYVFTGTGGGAFSAPVTIANQVGELASGDFNGDGRTELVMAGSNSTTVYWYVANAWQTAFIGGHGPLAIGDITGDGRADLLTHDYSRTNVYSLPVGSSSWSNLSVPDNGQGVMAVAEVTGDARLDLIIADPSSGTVRVLKNNIGGFSTVAEYTTNTNPLGIAVIDLNADGNRDLVLLLPSTLLIRYGLGGGTFGNSSSIAVAGQDRFLVAGDFTYDGIADIAVQAGNGTSATLQIYAGTPGGLQAFQSFISTASPAGIAAGDFDGDAWQDIVAIGTVPGQIFSPGVATLDFFGAQPVQRAVLTTSELTVGVHDLTATHAGVTSHKSQSVQMGSQTTSLTLNVPSNPQVGSTSIVTAQLTGNPAPTGFVTLRVNGDVIAKVPVTTTGAPASTGISQSVVWSQAGNLTVTATYTGDRNYRDATASRSVTIAPAFARVDLSISPGRGVFGDAFKLITTVSSDIPGVVPTGTVEFLGAAGVLSATVTPTPGWYSQQWPGNWPQSMERVAVADVTGDGIPDILGGDTSGVVMLQVGPMTAQSGVTASLVARFTTGFFNTNDPYDQLLAVDATGDGKIDIVVTDSNDMRVAAGSNDGKFAEPVKTTLPMPSARTAIGDLSGDGIPDLVTLDPQQFPQVPRFLRLYRGAANFSYSSWMTLPATNAYDVVVADVDGIAPLDLLVTQDATEVINGQSVTSTPLALQVYRGTASGPQSPPSQIGLSVLYDHGIDHARMATVDVAAMVTGGSRQLLVTTRDSVVHVISRAADGTLQEESSRRFSPGDTAFGDVSNDGLTDALVATGSGVTVSYGTTVARGIITTTNGLGVGHNYFVTTGYSGNSTFREGSSGQALVSVDPRPISLTVSTSPSPSPLSFPVTITAQFSAPIESQEPQYVQFSTPAGVFAGSVITDGKATAQTTALPAGATVITATVNGDYVGTGTHVHEVQRGESRLVLQASHSPTAAGSPVTIIATVRPVPLGAVRATGVVTFTRAGAPLATANVTNGLASFTIDRLAPGAHTIEASYAGDANFGPSSGSMSHVITGVATCMVASTTPNPSLEAQPVQVRVLCPSSSSSATINDNGQFLMDAPLSVAVTGLLAEGVVSHNFGSGGTHPLTAVTEAGVSAAYPHVVTLQPPVPPIQVTNLNDDGPGSLRQVIAAAPDGATIRIGSGIVRLEKPIALKGRRLTIEGGGILTSAIDAQNLSRHFVIMNQATTPSDITIKGLTLQNGFNLGGNGGAGNGGGGGAAGLGGSMFIDNLGGNVRLQGVIFWKNRAQGGNGGAGAGISDRQHRPEDLWNHGGGGGGGLDGNDGYPGEQLVTKGTRTGGDGGDGGVLGGIGGNGDEKGPGGIGHSNRDADHKGGPGAGGGGGVVSISVVVEPLDGNYANGARSYGAGDGGFGGGSGGGGTGDVDSSFAGWNGIAGFGGGSGGRDYYERLFDDDLPGLFGVAGAYGGAGATYGHRCWSSCFDDAWTGGGGGGGAALGGAVFIRVGNLILADTGMTKNEVIGGSGGITDGGDPGQDGQAKGGGLFAHTDATVQMLGFNAFASDNVAAGAGMGTPCPGSSPVDTTGVCASPTYGGAHVVSGDLQFVPVNTPFSPIVVGVNGPASESLPGVSISLVLPTSGPSATFGDGVTVLTAQTNASGRATFPTLTANSSAGSYKVRIFVGIAEFTSLTLTNTAPRQDTVTISGRSGTPSLSGSFTMFDVAVARGAGTTGPGSITILDGVNPVAAQSNVGNVGFGATSMLGVGLRKVRAVYSGDTGQPPTVSAPWWQSVLAKASSGLKTPASVQGFITGLGSLAVGQISGSLVGIVVGRSGGPTAFWVANSAFQTFGMPAYSGVIHSMAFADFDGDGKSDLAMSTKPTSGNGELAVMRTNGAGAAFISVIGSLPAGSIVATSDVNLDGRADIVTAGGSLAVYVGNGNGTFVRREIEAALNANDVAVLDVNADGVPDVVTVAEGTARVFLGTGQGWFTARSSYIGLHTAAAGAIAVADFNADGYDDIAVTTPGLAGSNGTFAVLLGQPDGNLALPSYYGVGYTAGDIASGDVDGDTRLDVVVTDRTNNRVMVYPGQGNGAFGAPAASALPGGPKSLAVNDLNRDAITDVVVTLENDILAVLEGQPVPNAIVTWATPAATTSTTPLGAAQLNAVSSSPGEFVYTPAAGSVLVPGTHTLSATFYPDSTEMFPQTITQTVAVTRGTLTITIQNGARTYGASDPQFNSTLAGALLPGLSIGYSTTALPASSPGTYVVHAHLVGAPALVAAVDVQDVPAVLTVTKAPLVVRADNKGMFYGGSLPPFTVSASGLRLGETAAVLSVNFTTSPGTVTNVGTYAINVSASSPNYAITVFNGLFFGGKLTVSRATVTVAIHNKTRAYGETNPELTGSLSGVVVPDDVSLTYFTPAFLSQPVGTAPIFVSSMQGASANNYVLYVPSSGTMTITKAPLSIVPANKSRPYGDANPGLTGSLVGLTGGDTANEATVTYSTEANVSYFVGGYPINVATATGEVLNNYTVKFESGLLWITPAPLFVTTEDRSRMYGAVNPGFASAITGARNGHVFTASSHTTTATPSTPVGTAEILANVTGNGLWNYELKPDNGTLTITPAPLSITAADRAREYGAPNPAFGGTYSGQQNNETFTVTGTSEATVLTAVGSAAIVPQVSGLTIDNYTVTPHSGTLTITPKLLTVTADNASRAYGVPNPSFEGSTSGLVNGDTVDVSYSSAATERSPIGAVAIVPQVSGTASVLSNYDVSKVDGTLTITAVPLTVNVDNEARSYWDPQPVFGGAIDGVVSGDNITVSYSSVAGSTTAAGTYPIVASLSDPDNRLTNYTVSKGEGVLTISNPAPAIGMLLAPAAAAAGAADSWTTISGSDFVPQSVASVDGVAVPTQFLSRTSLRAQVPSTALSAIGVRLITVNNAQPGGGTSEVAPFLVNHTGAGVMAITRLAGGSAATLDSEGAGSVTVTTAGSAMTTFALHAGNPAPTAPPGATGEYFTIAVEAGSLGLGLTACSDHGANRLMWFDGATWRRVRSQTSNSAGCATAAIGAASSPALSSLSTMYFAMVEDHAAAIAITNASIAVNEGATAVNSGTVAHVNDGAAVLTASIGTIVRDGNSWTWSYGATDGPAQSQTVTISGDDGYGNPVSLTFSLVVNNVVPSVSILDAPAGGAEGTSIPLSIGVIEPGSADDAAGVQTAWEVTKNGALFASGSGTALSFTPDDQGAYVVTVTATDKDGGASTTSAAINVTNVEPTAVLGAPATVFEGASFTLTLTAPSDPSSIDSTAGFTYAFDCGAGAGFGAFGAASATCATADNGTRAVAAKVRDKDGGVTTYTGTVTVTNLAPVSSITSVVSSTPPSIVPGVALLLAGTFDDLGTADSHQVTWNFGDGITATSTVASGASHALATSHAYANPGTYAIALTVTDDDGATVSSGASVVVQTPAAAALTLVNTINSIATLTTNEQKGLVQKLEAAASLTGGNAACAQHKNFVKDVEKLVKDGRLSAAAGAALIAADRSIQAALGCG